MKFIKYRVVTDEHCGFQIQVWRLWLPFWLEQGFLGNTHHTKELAIKQVEKLKNKNEVIFSE
tara:strand:- start:271 stop:456 length:186 start_codon:yes stop_codon:yes gene_type:complete